jgi:NhaP-type Na+/H+ and K+/H+ antiporter
VLAFFALGMLAGEDELLGIPCDDFGSAYLIGDAALAMTC